jgi:hypothetical protein
MIPPEAAWMEGADRLFLKAWSTPRTPGEMNEQWQDAIATLGKDKDPVPAFGKRTDVVLDMLQKLQCPASELALYIFDYLGEGFAPEMFDLPDFAGGPAKGWAKPENLPGFACLREPYRIGRKVLEGFKAWIGERPGEVAIIVSNKLAYARAQRMDDATLRALLLYDHLGLTISLFLVREAILAGRLPASVMDEYEQLDRCQHALATLTLERWWAMELGVDFCNWVLYEARRLKCAS